MDKALQKIIPQVATQSIGVVTDIADKAERALKESPSSGEVYGTNTFTDNAMLNLRNAGDAVNRDNRMLRDMPSYMRVDLADINGRNRISFYITPAAAPPGLDKWRKEGLEFVSYRAPYGRIASLPCGEEIRYNNTEYYITNKVEFKPTKSKQWDCRDVYIDRDGKKRVVLDSLREFLTKESTVVPEVDVKNILQKIEDEAATKDGRIRALTRNIRSTMDLRNQAALDQFQDEIFRLPIDSQRIILGPPGTGKTTTLIKRLGQKLDSSESSFTEEERTYLSDMNKEGLGFNKWIMFTPSKLLQAYLGKAFNHEGIAVQKNVVTWSDHAKLIARQSLGFLASAGKSGLRVDERNEIVKPAIIDDPRDWYNSFSMFFEAALSEELKNGLSNVEKAAASENQALIEQIKKIIEGKSNIFDKYKQLFALENKIKILIAKEKKVSDKIFEEERNLLINRNPKIIDELAQFLAQHKATEDEEDDETSYDDDEQEQETSLDQKNVALATYGRFIKKYARFKYLRKSLSKNSFDVKLKQWLDGQLPSDARLKALGRSISFQNGLRHNLHCWKRVYKKTAAVYRKYRQEKHAQIFFERPADKQKLSVAELDLVLLVTLRHIKRLLNESYIKRSLADARLSELKDLSDSLLKEQVLVDEATDFSVLQLACMEALTTPRLNSFFACGDFNQRLTNQGIKNSDLLEWISPKLESVRINTIYRQSPKLNKFTHAVLDLMQESDLESISELPDHIEYQGLQPVLLEDNDDLEITAEWITQRIVEIETIVNHNKQGEKLLPSIVVLVKDESLVVSMTDALNTYLDEYSLKASACVNGQSMGEEHDVRVCSIEFIKGLEFEAVFFVGVDQLLEDNPTLYQKFLYVGATRAANYLGITCEAELPEELESLRSHFGQSWNIEELDFI